MVNGKDVAMAVRNLDNNQSIQSINFLIVRYIWNIPNFFIQNYILTTDSAFAEYSNQF